MTKDTKSGVEEAVEELLTDPDSPANSDTSPPPQTIDAEPDDAVADRRDPAGRG